MPFARSRRKAGLAAAVSAAVALTGLQVVAATSATAASSTLVINEVYVNGGSSGATWTNKFVEIRNLTGASVALTGTSVQYRAPGSTGNSTTTVPLTGTVPANGYYVLSGGTNGANGAPVPNVNQTSGLNPGAGGGTITLVQGTTAVDPSSSTTVIDKIGYGTSNTPEGSAATGNSVTKVLGRSGPSTDTDANSADFSAQDGTPGTANPGGGSAALAATNPGARTATVGEAIAPFTLAATGGSTPYSWTASGLPAGITVNAAGEVTGTPTAAGTSTVTVTVTDAASPAATATATFTYTVTTGGPLAIADIQGTGATTPLTGQTVTTQGVVTASYPTGGLNGFYLQTPGPDTTPDASDAVFVYGGTTGFSTYPAVGDSVRVTATAGEFSGQTQLTAAQGGITVLPTSLGTVEPKTVVPGTDCALPGGDCLTGAALDAAREKVEGEAFQPTAPYTATDVYDGGPFYSTGTNSSSNFGEIGLAADSTSALVAPTEVIDAQAAADIAARKAYNDAHRVILDDASSVNYTTTTGSPFPWLTADHSVRVGAAVTFPSPVVFTYGFNTWRMIPSSQVVGAPSATQPQFAQTRAANTTPQDVGGDVRLATFNVLNFFPTTAEEFVSSGLGTCTYYTDRQGNRVTANSCNPNGPRGAADEANLARQRAKIVAAVNGSGADVVSLEELENSVKFGKDRDFAISALVTALNADAGAGTWAFAPSPAAAGLPALAEQDVIRTGFIYKPATVALVGPSVVLTSESSAGGDFEDAREPLAQAFKKVDTPDAGAFAVVVNHFKSKGSGTPDPNGQGNANDRRILQAQSLATFADDFAEQRGLTRTFLVGDFNAYSQEDPIQVLEAAGYTNLESTSDAGEKSYNFDGQIGSLDHVLANDAALADVNAVDVWPINAYESVYYEYSRFNYNVTNLHSDGPFRSSDHNPEVVGINVGAVKTATTTSADDVTAVEGDEAQVEVSVVAAGGTAVPTGDVTVSRGGEVLGTATLGAGGTATVAVPTTGLAAGTYDLTAAYAGDDAFTGSSTTLTLTVTSAVSKVQLLATNDFHGRIANDPSSSAAGAAVLAGAVKQLRTQNPNTVFAAAGDLIGASTFESFIAQDKPTLDALNSAGLEVSAVGNHEFDQGYDDLVNRVMKPYDAQTNPYGGAGWKYLGANVKFKDSGNDALEGTWIKDVDGVQVGFVGAVTEHLDELVSPSGIENIEVTDIVEATNEAADDLKAEGADVVVLLVHEGAPSTDCAVMDDDASSDFGSIVTGVDDNVDAIVSGHTHLAYNCSFPVPGWSDRAVKERPVVSAGQYGSNLNQVVFDVDRRTGDVVAKDQKVLALKTGNTTPNYPADAATASIVSAAVANADVLGAEPLGQIAGPFKRAKFADNATENRGAESTLGNLVAEVQRWATETPTAGSAQIAFMNPGGLRADLLGSTGTGAGATVTYKQAATVQPFANTLVNVKMTGAQVKDALEQQWQPAGSSRPFLRLGTSEGFTYTYDPNAPAGARITGMRLDGVVLDPSATYSVTVNSFLASGGDNFGAFNVAANLKQDTGKSDLVAMVDYLAEFANTAEGDDPLPVDASQRAVGVAFPAGAPSAYAPGEHVTFAVSSFAMTNADDPKDTAVEVRSGDTVLGTFPLDNAAQSGTAGGFDESGKASVDVVLPQLPSGAAELTLVGPTTGTEVVVPITVADAGATVTVSDLTVGFRSAARVKIEVSGEDGTPTGTVQVREGTRVIGQAALNGKGLATVVIPAGTFGPGEHELTAAYLGDGSNGASESPFTLTVTKAEPTVTGQDLSYSFGQSKTMRVRLGDLGGFSPSGTVTVSENGTVVTTQPVTGNVVLVPVPAQALSVGTHTLTVAYSGDANLAAASTTAQVQVTKEASKVTATVVGAATINQPVSLEVVVTNTRGVPVTGDAQVSVTGGATYAVTLVNGRGTVEVGPFATTGRKDVTVRYLGSDTLTASTKAVSFRVTR